MQNQKQHMVTSIILIRHGTAEIKPPNEPKIPGRGLTTTGKKQSIKTAQFLKGANFSKIYTSTMMRAIETAKLITTQEIIQCEELVEFNKIIFEEEPDDIDKFNENMEMAIRTKEFFEKIIRENRDSKILIVTHGNVIRYLICCALNLKHYKSPNFFIDNASITHLFFDGNKLISTGCINSTTHLFLDE